MSILIRIEPDTSRADLIAERKRLEIDLGYCTMNESNAGKFEKNVARKALSTAHNDLNLFNHLVAKSGVVL